MNKTYWATAFSPIIHPALKGIILGCLSLGCASISPPANAQVATADSAPQFSGPAAAPAPAQVPSQPAARPAPSNPNVPPGFWGSPTPAFPQEPTFESPVFRKILSLVEENFELKSELRVQAIENKAKEQIHRIKAENLLLREQLEKAAKAIKQANLEKELLDKQIMELEHRSRLLEERSKSLADQQPEPISIDHLSKFLSQLQLVFDRNLLKIQQPNGQAIQRQVTDENTVEGPEQDSSSKDEEQTLNDQRVDSPKND